MQPLREHRISDRTLAWLDEAFEGRYSGRLAATSAWAAFEGDAIVAVVAYGDRSTANAVASAEAGLGSLGPFAVVPGSRGRGIGTTLLHAALFSLRERGYRRAIVSDIANDEVAEFVAQRTAAQRRARSESAALVRPFRTTILASGNGTNFQAVLDASRAGKLPLEVAALVTNRDKAFVLERAARAGVPATRVVWNRTTESRAAYDARVLGAVQATNPEFVLLLGWMHVLAPEFVAAFPQIVNLHPAFLPLDSRSESVTLPDGAVIPAYRGKCAVDDALATGSGWIGVSVHRVEAEVDRGEILARVPLRLIPDETRETLDARLHALEHRLLATALRRWAREGSAG